MLNHIIQVDIIDDVNEVNYMFNKKFCIFIITLVLMLSVSAVSAADTNSTDDVAAGDVEEEPPSVSVEDISSAENDDVVAANQEKEIVLASDDFNIYYKSGDKYEVTVSQGGKAVSGVKVTISVSGASYDVTTNKNGVASLPINLKVGTHPISASYGSVKINNNLKVLPVVKGSDVTMQYGTVGKYTASFLQKGGQPLANTNVKISVAGKTYTVKTNKNGVATLPIGLKPGKYPISAIHPNGYKISNTITVKSSITSSNLVKYYGGSARFSATFLDKSGKPISNKQVKFAAHGKYFISTTNSKGVAYLSIISKPSKFTVTSINPVTGEKVSNTVQVLSTVSASNVNGFSYNNLVFKATLHDKNTGKVLGNKNIKIAANGVTKTVKTNANGVASIDLKFTNKGTFAIKTYDPNTGYTTTNYAYIKLATLKASALNVKENTPSTFKVTLSDQNKKPIANSNVQITVNGVSKTVRTDSKGVASLNFMVPKGTYYFVTKDPLTGYTLKTKVVASEVREATFNKYGVSSDGKTILAIGRASASGEMSKYGYSFYVTEFERECPYCHGHRLYWGIFWAGSETANYGVFPATGYKEGGSAEGHIFCADCDSDWSVFGHNHGGGGGDLTVVTPTTASSKADAYALLNGNYVLRV